MGVFFLCMRKYIGRFAMDEGFVEDKKENIDKNNCFDSFKK
jgi:hypothetical protein